MNNFTFKFTRAPLTLFLRRDIGIALLIVIAWQLAMTVLGIVFDYSFSGRPASAITTLSHIMNWDSSWYNHILNEGYTKKLAAPAFYPLYPLVLYLLKLATFGLLSTVALAFLINTITVWLAVYALAKIASHFLGTTWRWIVVALFLTSPAAIFLHMFYGEALFCAIAFSAYLLALKRKWLPMALLLGLLTAARLPSLLFIGLCGLEFLSAHHWNVRKTLADKKVWFFLVTPIGFLAYSAYLYLALGDFLRMFHAYQLSDDWTYHVFNPNILSTLLQSTKEYYALLVGNRVFDALAFVDIILPLTGLFLLGVCSIILLFRGQKYIPLGIFGLVAIAFFTLNSNIISVHRYLLPCIGLYIAPVVLLQSKKALEPLLYGIMYIGILLQAYLFILFVSTRFAG